ncbi:MAG TPA: monofunctional biosynthetic peptidoglycan transglycosylase [Caulobacteraceae bacterium]|nr:monofunctional biosynthetic peptidoglycan transglycosylase [Caulobacteraceae bacterium]
MARPERPRKRVKSKRRPLGGSVGGFLRGLFLAAVLIALALPIVWVLAYRYVPPPITVLMVERAFQGHGIDHRWRPISKISPDVVRAAIASEDAHFCGHNGFDLQAIDKALAHDERHRGRLRGGSTISQQTAKNVFLWPERSWVRKGVEAWFTVLIEQFWGKRRIMEVYLNTVEMGPGVYGVEAASRRYFHTDAADLTSAEAARLVAVLPNPLNWSARAPGSYVRKRTGRIDARANVVDGRGLADCVLR